MKPWAMMRRFGAAPALGGGDPEPEAVAWTDRGSNSVSISGNSILLNAETSGSGLTAANAYSQATDFSGFTVGGKITAEFDRTYSGAWWDDTFVNASFVTCLWLETVGSDVGLESGTWYYQRVRNDNGIGAKIEWRRTYGLAPMVTIVTEGNNVVFSGLMTEVATGSVAENSGCSIRVELTWPTSDSVAVDVFIDGAHRYTASGTNASVTGQIPATGCFFVHAHNYGGAATVGVNNASVGVA